ncbi:MAG: GNAT family N-acetyltransferase [Halioglobus sp.]
MAEKTFRDTFSLETSSSDMALHCKESFSPDIQQREISDPSMVTLLAEIKSQLVGFAQIRLVSSTACVVTKHTSELYRLYVSNEWHGKGVAHKLMPEVFATAAGVKSECIWLGVWEHNSRAVSFYRKNNFEICGEHIFQLGNDPQRDLIMVAQVGEKYANVSY